MDKRPGTVRDFKEKVVSDKYIKKDNYVINKTKLLLIFCIILLIGIASIIGGFLLFSDNNNDDKNNETDNKIIDFISLKNNNKNMNNSTNNSEENSTSIENIESTSNMPEGYYPSEYNNRGDVDEPNMNQEESISSYVQSQFNMADQDSDGYITSTELAEYLGVGYREADMIFARHPHSYNYGWDIDEFASYIG